MVALFMSLTVASESLCVDFPWLEVFHVSPFSIHVTCRFGTFRMFMLFMDCPDKPVHVSPFMKVSDFLKVYVDGQFVFHRGKLLQPSEKTLTECGMKADDVLLVVDRPGGCAE